MEGSDLALSINLIPIQMFQGFLSEDHVFAVAVQLSKETRTHIAQVYLDLAIWMTFFSTLSNS